MKSVSLPPTFFHETGAWLIAVVSDSVVAGTAGASLSLGCETGGGRCNVGPPMCSRNVIVVLGPTVWCQ